MSRSAALIEALSAIHPKGYDLSLDRIRALLSRLDNPQRKMPPVIHVAGTNGKGSTIAFLRAILEAHGLSVHAHTSPHLVRWEERYRIGQPGASRLVSDHELASAIEEVREANAREPITVFELLCAVMFLLFSQKPADVALVEVGLGGRLDATNVIEKPAISVITPVSMDHEAWLGDTVEKIAAEKGGIIKPGVPVIIGEQLPGAEDVLTEIARKNRSQALVQGQHFSAGEDQGRMIFQHEAGLYDLPLPALQGRHQIGNAALSLATAGLFLKSTGRTIDTAALEEAMSDVTWPARMQRLTAGTIAERLGSNASVWVDGGHNVSAASAIASWLGSHSRQRGIPTDMISGMLTTKNPTGYLEQLQPFVRNMLTVPLPSSDAGYSPEELAGHALSVGISAKPTASLDEAISRFSTDSGPRIILISGSLYLAGDALALNGVGAP